MQNNRAPIFSSLPLVRVLTLLCLLLPLQKARAGHELLLVTGLSGQAAFGAEMEATAKVWMEAAKRGG